MKVVRGIFSGIFGIVLFVLIFALSFSYILKNVIKKDVLNGILKQQLINQYTEDVDDDIKNSIEELIGKNDISDIAESILLEYSKFAKDKDYKVSDEFIDKIIDFCVKNKDLISKISKEEFDEEKLRSEESRNSLKKALNEKLPEISKEIGESGDIVMFIYSVIVSRVVRLAVFFAIITIILLIALLTWSVYKWLTPLGISLIVSGVLYTSLYALIMACKEDLIRELNMNINFNPVVIVIIGGGELVFGILAIVIKKLIDKNSNKVEENYGL